MSEQHWATKLGDELLHVRGLALTADTLLQAMQARDPLGIGLDVAPARASFQSAAKTLEASIRVLGEIEAQDAKQAPAEGKQDHG